jgi:hypothetical protein
MGDVDGGEKGNTLVQRILVQLEQYSVLHFNTQ